MYGIGLFATLFVVAGTVTEEQLRRCLDPAATSVELHLGKAR